MTRVVNLFGGPGSGKSTLAAGMFVALKNRGAKVELVREYAKELLYDCDFRSFEDQYKILKEQDWRQRSLLGEVDWIITDAALPMGLIYAPARFRNDPRFVRKVWALWKSYTNINILVRRHKPYEEYGRAQTEDEAISVDHEAEMLLECNDIPFLDTDDTGLDPQVLVKSLTGEFE